MDRFGRSPGYEAVVNKNKKICYELRNNGARVIANPEELTNRILRSTKDGDLEFIKLLYFTGIKNLHEYINSDNRNLGHIVLGLSLSLGCLRRKD